MAPINNSKDWFKIIGVVSTIVLALFIPLVGVVYGLTMDKISTNEKCIAKNATSIDALPSNVKRNTADIEALAEKTDSTNKIAITVEQRVIALQAMIEKVIRSQDRTEDWIINHHDAP